MILCDVGNSFLDFYEVASQKRVKIKVDDFSKSCEFYSKKVYFISVNARLNYPSTWINLESLIDRSRYYESMGIDRIVACEALHNGVVVDAGSAITVDTMFEGRFEGGFIYPGVAAMKQCFKNISPKLHTEFNFELNLDKMPRNTKDALSYGFLAPLLSEIKRYIKNYIVLTGGDAKLLKPYLPQAVVDENLIFHSMQKIIENSNIEKKKDIIRC